MKKVRLWNIEFGNYSGRIIEAKNVKDAMKKALNKRNKTWIYQSLHKITKIELIAETD